MFSEFKTINESNTFEILDNGFLIRLSGRSTSGDWINKSFVFQTRESFLAAITELCDKDSE